MLDGAFTAISTTFRFVEFCYAIGDVPEECLVFIRLIQRVRDDLDECLRLLSLPAIQDHLERDSDQNRYINGTVEDTKGALAGIGKYVENVRIEEEGNGEISLRTRFEWILRHQYKLQSRQVGLDTCHKSLLQAMSRLALLQHTVALARRGLPRYNEVSDEDGLANATRADAKIMSDDEITDFLTTRNRRTRPSRGETLSESPLSEPRTNNSSAEDIEWSPRPPPINLEQPFIPPLTGASRMFSLQVRDSEGTSYLHPGIAELEYDLARPSTAAPNMTGSMHLDEPAITPRLRSFSSSSTLASTAHTVSSDSRSPNTKTFSLLPTPFFLPERPRSSHSTNSSEHLSQNQSTFPPGGIEQFRMRPQSFAYAPNYHTHHAKFSVGSGILDVSLQSSTYSTLHQNLSAVSGFSELPAQSPRQERSLSNLAPNPKCPQQWNHDPDANAPEVVWPELVPPIQRKTPTYIAYSPLRRSSPPPMADYSIPEVVPVEHESQIESLPQVTAHAPLHPRRSVDTNLQSVPQSKLQLPSQPQRTLTQSQERREKTRARLNLIAGE